MDIRKYPANAGNVGGTRAASGIRYIVIHYTGNDGDTAMNNAKYYASNVVKTSAHYFVDANEIVQSVDDLRIAWAVGGKKYPSCPQTGGGTLHGRCLNANSISIELCDAKKDGVYAPSAKTVAQALELTKALMKKYNIPASNVIRHFDVTGAIWAEPIRIDAFYSLDGPVSPPYYTEVTVGGRKMQRGGKELLLEG